MGAKVATSKDCPWSAWSVITIASFVVKGTARDQNNIMRQHSDLEWDLLQLEV